MTLQELFDFIAQHPAYIIFYFAIIPFAAFLAGVLSRRESHLPPWNILYAVLIYAVCIPGIFAVTLNVYLFLFENRSIMEMDIYTQILPTLSMIVTLVIIRRYVHFDYIPGFDTLTSLITIIAATLGIMWFIDRTKIWLLSYVRIEIVVLFFIALLLVIRFSWSRMFGKAHR